MAGDTEPRAEFTASLREWFVEEMRRPAGDADDAPGVPATPASTVPESRGADRQRRWPNRWLLLAQAAAVIGVVAGLWWLSSGSDETTAPPPVASAPPASTDPALVARSTCREFRAEMPALALGASPDEVVQAATEVRARLVAASARLDESLPALAGSRRLVAEAIDAADRLVDVAQEERASVDAAVRNLDLIIAAWSRELSSVANDEVCTDLPTLREVL